MADTETKPLKPYELRKLRNFLRAADESFSTIKELGQRISVAPGTARSYYDLAKNSILRKKLVIKPEDMGYMGHCLMEIYFHRAGGHALLLSMNEVRQLFRIGPTHYLAQVYYEFPEDLPKLIQKIKVEGRTKYLNVAHVREAWL